MFKGNNGLYKVEVGEAKIVMDEEKFVVAVPYRVTPKESFPHVRAYLNDKKETVVSVNFAPFSLEGVIYEYTIGETARCKTAVATEVDGVLYVSIKRWSGARKDKDKKED